MNQNINLNLIPDGVNPVVTASQYDEKRVITFTLYDGTSAYTIPNGTEIEVRGLKGDDKVFIYNEDDLLPDNTPIVSWSGNVITVNTALQMTACYGDVLTQFKLTNGGMTIATLNFVLRVQRDPAADGDISETELPAIIAEATEQMRRAEAAAVAADGRAEDSEAWAVGTRDSSPVGSSDPTYHNNSKYYADEAGDAKTAAETAQGLAETAQGKAEDAQTAAETAQGKAEDAQTAAESAQTAAETSELNAEAWAVGTKDGTAVPSTDPQHHNNSKYWSDLAAQYAAQFGSAVKWRGAVAFANIPTSGMMNGDLYDITDSFTTDSRFVIGPGVLEPAGTDIIWNETASKWDIDTPSGVTSFNGRMGAVTPQSGDYSKGDVGLGNVDNTSDLNKPISTATQTALDEKMKKATGTAGQFVGYDSNGDPEAQFLPVMTGATMLADGTMGMLPPPTIADRDKFFGGDGAWHTPAGSGSGHTIMDENGNTFTNRPVLQFMDSDITDDSVNDRTIITPHGGTKIVQIPSVVGTTFTYTGSAIGPQVTGLDTEHTTITGATATDVGSYTLTAALNDPSRMVWADMTTEDKTFAYTITKMPITIPTVTGSFTYDGTEKSCTISPASSDYYTQTGTTASTNAGTFSITFELNDTANTEWSDGTTADKVLSWTIAKASQTISISPSSVMVGVGMQATVTVSGAQTSISATPSSASVIITSVNGSTVTIYGQSGATGATATVTIQAQSNANYNTSNTKTVSVSTRPLIYGVDWDGTSTTAFSRTDDAANFTNPNPYYSGMTGTPSSPFDNISPWKDMVVSERTGGTMVAIPKFYFKLGYHSGTTGLKIQIADGQYANWALANRYQISPAHKDRGDGKGERDVVYVGAYHCASDYKSKSGVQPTGSKTRSAFRSGIHNLGANIWQWDIAMLRTIQLLYLVEFGNWNSQATIGYGCGNNTGIENNGTTNNISYHTGTTTSGRTVYGHTKYRGIEDLWGNVFDWIDGIRYDTNNTYIILNPSDFSDTANGTLVCTPSSVTNQYSKAMSISSASGYEWYMYHSDVGGSDTTYITDQYTYYNASSAKTLFVGGRYLHELIRGLFFEYNGYAINTTDSYLGSRIMELP